MVMMESVAGEGKSILRFSFVGFAVDGMDFKPKNGIFRDEVPIFEGENPKGKKNEKNKNSQYCARFFYLNSLE